MANPTRNSEPLPEPWGTLARLLRDVGFPIFVAAYLLAQVNPALLNLREALVELTHTQRQLVVQQGEILRELRRP